MSIAGVVTLFRDWKGQIQDETGRQVPYSPENAAALLSGDSDLFTWVLLHAAQLAKEAQEEAKETVEKSSPGSSGKRVGQAKPKRKLIYAKLGAAVRRGSLGSDY